MDVSMCVRSTYFYHFLRRLHVCTCLRLGGLLFLCAFSQLLVQLQAEDNENFTVYMFRGYLGKPSQVLQQSITVSIYMNTSDASAESDISFEVSPC